jgi:hypothetical protein
MKKFLLTALLFITITSVHAQWYTFTQTNEPYSTIHNGTVISTAGWDYQNTFAVPFPFQFNYFNAAFDTFWVSGGMGGFEYYGSGTYGDYILYFYDAPVFDLGFGLSPISYYVQGNPGSRILILQLENAGFIYDQQQTDYFEVQVWFYETTNVIEIHYGPSSVQNNASWYPNYQGPTVALDMDGTTYYELYGQSSNASFSSNPPVDYVTGSPQATTVYRFTPTVNGIEKINSLPVSVYPNPSNGNLTLNSSLLKSDATLSVYDLNGRLLLTESIGAGIHHYSFDFVDGVYLLKINSADGDYIQRLVINRQ